MKILVVDDEESIREALQMAFELQGYEVQLACSGRQGWQSFHEHRPDLVVLDRMMPDGDGLQLCAQIRAHGQVPILMLTALGELDERVSGLDSGADDYLAKPFKVKELLARVRALLRRTRPPEAVSMLQQGTLKLDLASFTVTHHDQSVPLTAKEFHLLRYLLEHVGQVFSKEQLLDRVWGELEAVNVNVVEVHISSLRSKLADHDKSLIRTVRGMGYRLEPGWKD